MYLPSEACTATLVSAVERTHFGNPNPAVRFDSQHRKAVCMTFDELGLGAELLSAIADAGYAQPTPIQEKAIPHVLMGRDILGCAQTGTGKTASFTLPMIDILASGRAKARLPRSLILEPTRELAAQVAENFTKYGKYHKLTMALLIGGESFVDQQRKLDRGVDVLIATPGRLLDLFERGKILMSDVKILVIDESDRMLDMGFMPDVERIVGLLPKIRQTLFFSATMAPEIRKLADKFLMNPKVISVDPPATAAVTVAQELIPVAARDKTRTLNDLLEVEGVRSALVFCNRKRDVDTLFRSLKRRGRSVAALHGDLAQPTRMATLDSFRNGEVEVLVCSDVAARGLDIPAVSHVFNFDVPVNPEDYVHRIGRTGRAGRQGHALMLATPSERKQVAAIEKLTGMTIPVAASPKKDQAAVASAEPAPAAADEDEVTGEEITGGVIAESPARRRTRGGTGKASSKPGRTSGRGRDKVPANSPFGDHTPAFMLRAVALPA
jgi:superfamily II DNA/RNA helicase